MIHFFGFTTLFPTKIRIFPNFAHFSTSKCSNLDTSFRKANRVELDFLRLSLSWILLFYMEFDQNPLSISFSLKNLTAFLIDVYGLNLLKR